MIHILLFIAIIFSQFYIFSSGLPQPAHMLFSLFFLIIFFRVSQTKKLKIIKSAHILVYFFIYVLLVNFFFLVYLQNIDFLVSSVYLLFGLLVFYSINYYLIIYKKSFDVLLYSSLIALIILFLLTLFSIGRYDFFPRFNAFFNDPNQMAFWALSIACVFIQISTIKKIKSLLVFIFFMITLFIVFRTASRSALLGLVPLLLAVIFIYRSSFNNRYIKILSVTLLLGIIFLGLYFSAYSEEIQFIFERFSSIDHNDQLDVRGYSRFVNYPEFLLFGSGQGADYRFNSENEIHSTWGGIFFYYGIIGMSIFIFFIGKLFVKMSITDKLIFLTPFFYGFSTYSARTPVFWLYISVSFFVVNYKLQNKSKFV